MTSSSEKTWPTSLAATRWPLWIGSKVPPITPMRFPAACPAIEGLERAPAAAGAPGSSSDGIADPGERLGLRPQPALDLDVVGAAVGLHPDGSASKLEHAAMAVVAAAAPRRFGPALQLVGEQQVRQLGLPVSAHPPVAAAEVQVIEVNLPGLVAVAADGHHARSRYLQQAAQGQPVSARWPRWLVPNCSSKPSSVSWEGGIIT